MIKPLKNASTAKRRLPKKRAEKTTKRLLFKKTTHTEIKKTNKILGKKSLFGELFKKRL